MAVLRDAKLPPLSRMGNTFAVNRACGARNALIQTPLFRDEKKNEPMPCCYRPQMTETCEHGHKRLLRGRNLAEAARQACYAATGLNGTCLFLMQDQPANSSRKETPGILPFSPQHASYRGGLSRRQLVSRQARSAQPLQRPQLAPLARTTSLSRWGILIGPRNDAKQMGGQAA